MSNAYNHLPKMARVLPSRYTHGWFVILAVMAGLIGGGVSSMPVLRSKVGRAVMASLERPSRRWTANRAVRTGKLYILSDIVGSDGANVVDGRMTILDAATRQALYSTKTGGGGDAMLAPDGSRLYIVGADPALAGKFSALPREQFFAVDTQTGKELWRVPIENRVAYILGDGPPTLTISADGRWLYLYKYPVGKLDKYANASEVPFWFDIIDARTGQVVGQTAPLLGCDAAMLAAARDGGALIVTCAGTNDVRFINLRTRQIERLNIPGPKYAGPAGRIAGAVLSVDGRKLYLVIDNLQLAIVDVTQRNITTLIDLGRQNGRVVVGGAVTLSPDGNRLFVGLQTGAKGNDAGGEIRMYDTQTWKAAGRLSLGRPLRGNALAVTPDGRSIFSVGSKALAPDDTILKLSTGTGAAPSVQASVVAVRDRENILRIFTGP